ncbi:MAG: 2-oxo-4-hydroxy-4-carboxy-5-ureidoimidazoline decarboxylase [Cyanobacteria bacterium P01_H01_bin.121]
MGILTVLNQASPEKFVTILGGIFENSPEIAAQARSERPFKSLQELHKCMTTIVSRLPAEAQLALIQAHPDLGGRVKMADASVREQASVGLDQLTAEEFEQFQVLNRRYRTKFGFPFIIAVRNHTRAEILQAFERRLAQTRAAEVDQALAEIGQIAWFRLAELVTDESKA